MTEPQDTENYEHDTGGIMKVLREMQIKTDNFIVGDRIRVKINNEKHYATAIRQDKDGMLFLFDDCLNEARTMNKSGSTEGGYEESDLRKWLNTIDLTMPEKLLSKMAPLEHGDFLSLLDMKEAFGLDTDYNSVPGQIPWLKDRRHRVADRRGKDYEYWWLRDVVNGTYFAFVDANGYADTYYASNTLGVRPCFKIENL